jgi:flagellar protein FliL
MPDDEKTKLVKDGSGEEAAPKKKGLPLKKIGLLAAVIVVLMAAAYFVTLKVIKPMVAGGKGQPTAQKADEPKADEGEKSKTKHGEEKSAEGGAGSIYLIENIVVNPAGTEGRRFLSASVGFEMATGAGSQLLTEREAVVRDALITILSAQTVPDLSDYKRREQLRQLIKLRMEKLLQTKEIAAVYFTEFVLQ